MTHAALLRYALSHHRAGRLDVAERSYRGVLAATPESPEALHLLGQLLVQRGTAAEAEPLLRRVVALAPGIAIYHASLGEALSRMGTPDAAEEALARALALDGDLAEAWSARGALAKAAGRLDAAAAHFARALALSPDHAPAHNNLAVVRLEQGDAAAAAAGLREAVALDPALAEAHANLANALTALGQPAAAVASFDAALALAPDGAVILANRAAALAACGDLDGAIAGYRQALALAPDDASFHHGLGVALQRAGRFAEAAAAYRGAVDRDPDHPEALTNLGNALIRGGQVEDGLAALERALARDADDDRAYFGLITSLPAACEWSRIHALSASLAERVARLAAAPAARRGAMLPLAFTLPYLSTDIALHKRVLQAVAERVAERSPPPSPAFVHELGSAGRRLRIGYLSPDFGDHPIGHVTVPVYERHDRTRFEVHCYATVDRARAGGEHFRRIHDAADRFTDLSRMSLRETAERIHADAIDVLVDLCGYMPGGRPDSLAMRPAPIQVYWLGHGGGLGARAIDYVIGDPLVTPPGDDGYYVEAIARLPETFSSADRAAIAAAVPSRAEQGLPATGTVFCAFNNALKIDRPAFDRWMEILAGVADSVLWLTAGEAAARRLRAAAEAAGIAGRRLVFADRVADKAAHFARHALAELFLDTLTFNASTTALDALWAGLPVLTVTGPHFHSRIASGYLAAVGMPGLACADAEAYVARAIALAQSPRELAALKAELAEKRLSEPLFDGRRFTRHLEAAYEQMWRRHRDRLPPVSFDVAPLPREMSAKEKRP